MKIPCKTVGDVFTKKLAEFGLPAEVRVNECEFHPLRRTIHMDLDMGMTAMDLAEAVRMARL